ncbi:AraC family transcriptional regulator [Pseudonocardia sp. ICBG162]|uniref:helix-turn-helix domain-containing protein n=1 Tax=Pseudonocardia sp. ICBG162 TaxID=2846761 RepID=UPI001CF6C0A7|nr:helix-turn-helix domain-containing protein [Pseudonocardia sp. ICBG162]
MSDGARRWRPSARLRPLVSGIWCWSSPAGPAGTHQGVSSAHLTVVLCLDGAIDLLAAPDPRRGPGRFTASAAGLHAAPAVLATGTRQAGMQLEMTWRGARTLLGLPAGELAGDVVDLALLLPGLDTLLDRLRAEPGWAGRCALLDAALCAVADARDRPGDPPPEVVRAWELLARSGGTARVADVAGEVGWSQRHLGERLRRETGLATKAAARVIRFERACTLLRRPSAPPLAELAAICGYADQQHLARDFRDLAGTTASTWRAERVRPAAPIRPRPRRPAPAPSYP